MINNNIKISKKLNFTIVFIFMSLWLNSCILNSASPEIPVFTHTSTPIPSNTFVPTNTVTPTVIPTSTPTSTPQPTATFTPTNTTPIILNAEVLADTLNVREGPGTTFQIIFKLQIGDSVTVESRAPGNEWVSIRTPDDQSGWTSLAFLRLDGDLNNSKLQEIDFAYVVQGKVTDSSGDPVNDINLAVTGNNGTDRTDARTTNSGEFFAYLPMDDGSEWQVSVAGIGCKSRIVDQDCNYVGSFEPSAISIILPIQKIIEFSYFP